MLVDAVNDDEVPVRSAPILSIALVAHAIVDGDEDPPLVPQAGSYKVAAGTLRVVGQVEHAYRLHQVGVDDVDAVLAALVPSTEALKRHVEDAVVHPGLASCVVEYVVEVRVLERAFLEREVCTVVMGRIQHSEARQRCVSKRIWQWHVLTLQSNRFKLVVVARYL